MCVLYQKAPFRKVSYVFISFQIFFNYEHQSFRPVVYAGWYILLFQNVTSVKRAGGLGKVNISDRELLNGARDRRGQIYTYEDGQGEK